MIDNYAETGRHTVQCFAIFSLVKNVSQWLLPKRTYSASALAVACHGPGMEVASRAENVKLCRSVIFVPEIKMTTCLRKINHTEKRNQIEFYSTQKSRKISD